jgi:hypothetical protein
LASSVNAAVMRRHVAAPLPSPAVASSCARGAFLERPIAATLEHELRHPPNVDPWVSRRKSCTAAVEKGLS